MHWWLYWVQHNSTLFLQEAIWNLFVHRGNQSFPVVFEPGEVKKDETFRGDKGQISLLQKQKKMSWADPYNC